jgi:protein-S-isoprenylcysteine O-methyltransferase Ste14
MMQDAAHHSILRTSDFIALIAISLGALVEYLLLWHWSLPLALWVRAVVGTLVVGLGVVLISSTKSALRAIDQVSEPGKPTTKITTSGVFSRSRNPSYLGVALLIFGLGVAFNFVAWVFASALAVIAMHYLLVMPEERYLLARFPVEYGEYMRSVRRWI